MSASGRLILVSTKPQVCDLISVQNLLEASFPEADRPHAFTLHFFDGSNITFAAEDVADATNWKKEINRALQVHNRFSKSLAVATGLYLEEPPFQKLECSCYNPDTWKGFWQSKLYGTSVSKHQRLFWFGAKGKAVMLVLCIMYM